MAKAKPATHDEIARFGHIAAAIRAGMKARDWGLPQLNEALGNRREDSSSFKWTHGTGAPGAVNRAKLAALFGIPEVDLMPRDGWGAPKAMITGPMNAGPVIIGPASKPAAVRPVDVLLFRVTAEGEAQIKLDVTLPLATAQPLLRMLLDAGVVFGSDKPD